MYQLMSSAWCAKRSPSSISPDTMKETSQTATNVFGLPIFLGEISALQILEWDLYIIRQLGGHHRHNLGAITNLITVPFRFLSGCFHFLQIFFQFLGRFQKLAPLPPIKEDF